MATLKVKDYETGLATEVNKLPIGPTTRANAVPMALATEDLAYIDGIESKLDTVNTNLTLVNDKLATMATNEATTTTAFTNITVGEYETVAASQTAQVLGTTGAAGNYLDRVVIIPATTSPGVVTLLDNATSIPLFVGGASSISDLTPRVVSLGMTSVSGAWKISTGANVSVIAVGNFT
jgi:hypothetical protein